MPVVKQAKKAIASFKIREGMPVGLTVTLRKNRMMEFYDRLVNIAMPRIKDFRGYSKKSFDGNGNITIGIRDHVIFPEISVENVENLFGFDITIATSAKNDKQGIELLKLMNFPFYN
jgi:large subunit ribosomal protein L5